MTDADPGVKSKAGFTPLHMAAQEGHEDCVEMLIERGADVNVPANNGKNQRVNPYELHTASLGMYKFECKSLLLMFCHKRSVFAYKKRIEIKKNYLTR